MQPPQSKKSIIYTIYKYFGQFWVMYSNSDRYSWAMSGSYRIRRFSSFFVSALFVGLKLPVITVLLSMMNTLWCIAAGFLSRTTSAPALFSFSNSEYWLFWLLSNTPLI